MDAHSDLVTEENVERLFVPVDVNSHLVHKAGNEVAAILTHIDTNVAAPYPSCCHLRRLRHSCCSEICILVACELDTSCVHIDMGSLESGKVRADSLHEFLYAGVLVLCLPCHCNLSECWSNL